MEYSKKSLLTKRVCLSLIFFCYGLSYASWASRIPDIQKQLHLSDTALGGILLGMPVGSFLTIMFSGYLVSKIGSRRVITFASLIYGSLLICVGYSQTVWQLAISLFFFGSAGNMLNIAINTQAISLESHYTKRIMSSFHGMWSVAGLIAAAVGSLLMAKAFPVNQHFLYISIFAMLTFAICARLLLAEKGKPTQAVRFALPGKYFLILGFISFCSMMCQGAMFDWSGVYFDKVVKVERVNIGLGYTAFMIAMTSTRFISDWLTHHFGFKKIIAFCGLITCVGLITATQFPYLWPATIGLFLVGMGVSPVVPLVFSEAGKSKIMAPGIAIATVSTLGFVGLLIGPPMIGFIAGLTSLKISFIVLSVVGLAVTFGAYSFQPNNTDHK
ncbi:MAG: MFS transporter [Ginsengibacter sp.]